MAEIKYKIVKSLGVLSESGNGWRKEVNIISWNGRKPKLDIRDWDENHERMRKGITLHADEVETLKSILEEFDPMELEEE
jgi:hypothetical protein